MDPHHSGVALTSTCGRRVAVDVVRLELGSGMGGGGVLG